MPQGNVEGLHKLADSCARALCLQLRGWQQVSFQVAAHPAQWLLEHALANGFAKCGIRPLTSSDSFPRLAVVIMDIGVSYERLSGDSLRRRLRLSIVATLSLPTGDFLPFPPWRAVSEDVLSISYLGSVDHPAYVFATAALPEQRSVWRELVEPLLAIAAGGVILLLLFTLRTR
ncbi:MAG: hypothetical protein NZ949_00510 [Candidatus Kapabacteria bacterium]|nr:hypothetical protein [Candidatus Kapabacteria bacterium]